MPRMQILTPAEFNAFERPPAFSHVERQRFFDLSPRFEHLLSSFRTPTNQICFVLALGYFRATKRFFARQFREPDAEYVTQQLGILPGVFDLKSYKETTARSHRKLILDYLGFQPFNTQARQHLADEVHTLIRSQVPPKAMFLHALDVLARRKTEIPSAYLLTDLIVHEIRRHSQIAQAAPLGFLESEEQEAVLDETGDIRVSLYKALLFAKIAEALKGGVLNLRHSYKYRSLDDYLIPKDDWQAHRHDYLQRANLMAVADCEPTLNALATRLDAQYHQTNRHILAEENPHVHFRKDGSFHVGTPKADPEDSEPLLSVLPTRRYVSLLEVLATVNRFTHFLDAFEPWRVQYARTKPPDRTFFAGITGYGCFIGTRKMASISSGIAESELESTVNGYFTLDNVHGANDRIIEFMDQLSLPQVYRQPGEPLHTSSDGQKFEVAVDSLHASYSFKYFGQEKGVSAS